MLPDDGCPAHPRGSVGTKSAAGHQRKSVTTLVMSVKPQKAEVAIHEADVRYVPIGDIHYPSNESTLWGISDRDLAWEVTHN